MELNDVLEAMRSLEREKSVPFESLLEGLQQALAAAYKRSLPEEEGARVEIDILTGEMRVFAHDVDENGQPVRDETGAIANERALGPRPFGRIEAQTAKQVMLQKIREFEREQTYGEFREREGDIVTGIVQQSDARYTILDLGKNVEALMPQSEQVPSERYDHGQRVKAYVVEVRRQPKGPSIIASRTHPGLVRRLFELEVPEIQDGTVEIKGIAREAGHRTKIAVASNEPAVDPVGACVGAKGSRVRMVVNELHGEKLDIIPWNEVPGEYVAASLSPAKVSEVKINERDRSALVIVPDYQLSLAIGKEGQNARLAARLTGWRIDIKSESQHGEQERVLAQARGQSDAAGPAPAPEAEQPAGDAAEPDAVVAAEADPVATVGEERDDEPDREAATGGSP